MDGPRDYHTKWSQRKSNIVWYHLYVVALVQSLSCVQLFAAPRTVASLAPLSFSISQTLLRFMFIESMMLSHHLIPCHPLLFLPSIFPSIRVFSKELALHIRWPKSASVLLMNIQGRFPLGLTGLISLLVKGLSRVFLNTTTESISVKSEKVVQMSLFIKQK